MRRGVVTRLRGLRRWVAQAVALALILPVLIGDAERAVAVGTRLLDEGVYVAAIRPPTVPPGTSRLRVSLMATHTEADIATAARAIVSAVKAT